MDRAMEEFVERVRSESDIVSVISAYVSLKRKGNRYWGCCPFHQEKTPSFSVVPAQGFFYCFGCHVGGDVFRFLMLTESISFWDAVKMQAEKLNIPMPQREKTEQELQKDKQLDDMRRVQEMARDFFHSCLTKTKYGTSAKAYLHGRGISDDIIEEFSLGYAPDSYDKLQVAFRKRGVSDKLLADCGLTVEKSSGGAYDRFRNRVMIPIADEFGHVVGFGGRIMDEGQPKYLNSPETMLFNKRRLLFGLNKSKQAIRQAGYVILTEGYMDTISLYAAGVKNVVASLGTAFTIEHCRKLLRYTQNIYFCYDSDEAGQNATMRALTIVRETGAKVKVLVVPDGKDPDEFIRKHGTEAFLKLTEKALPLAEYQIKYVLKHHDCSTLEGKTAALTEILPVLKEINSMVELNEYIARLTRVLGIDEGVLRSEFSRYAGRTIKAEERREPIRQAVQQIDNAVRRAGRIVLRRVWQEGGNGQILSELAALVPFESFPFAVQGEIFSALEACLMSDRPLSSVLTAGTLSEAAAAELSMALAEEDAAAGAAYEDSVKVLRQEYLKRQYELHRLRADTLQREGNDDFLRELAESQRIKKEMDELRIE